MTESTKRLTRTILRGRASSRVLWGCGVHIIGKDRIWLQSIISGHQLYIALSEVRPHISPGGVCGRRSATRRVLLWGLYVPFMSPSDHISSTRILFLCRVVMQRATWTTTKNDNY